MNRCDCRSLCLDDKHVLLGPRWRRILRRARERDVPFLVDSLRQVLRDAHNSLCLEHRARGKVEEGEFRLRAAQTGHARAGFRGLSIPQNAIAGRMGHWSTTSEIIVQAAFALAEFRGRDFVGKMHVAGAPCLGKTLEEGFGPLELIEGDVASSAGCDGYHNLCDPIRVCGAARNIYYGKTGL